MQRGNWYFKNAANGKNLVSAWAHIENPYAGAGQPKDSWFHFDANGVMQTGWFKDSDGRWYFFNPVSDSTLGRMMTGWNWIKGNDGKSFAAIISRRSPTDTAEPCIPERQLRTVIRLMRTVHGQ